MNPQSVKLRVLVAMNADNFNYSKALIRTLFKRERIFAGIKALALSWAIALICVFIPVAHFLLVPGFLVFGIVIGTLKFNLPFEMNSEKIVCPNCQIDFEIRNLSFKWPLRKECSACQMVLLIDPVATSE